MRHQPDFSTGVRTPQAGIPRPGLRYLGSQSKLLVGSYVVISFLRGLLINHGTPPQYFGDPVESNRPLL